MVSDGDRDVIPVLGSVTKVSERWGVPSLNICLWATRGRVINRCLSFVIEVWIRFDFKFRSNCLPRYLRDLIVFRTCVIQSGRSAYAMLDLYVICFCFLSVLSIIAVVLHLCQSPVKVGRDTCLKRQGSEDDAIWAGLSVLNWYLSNFQLVVLEFLVLFDGASGVCFIPVVEMSSRVRFRA